MEVDDPSRILEQHASNVWGRFARRYGYTIPYPPPEYLEKYVNEVRVYGADLANARLEVFTRTIMVSPFARDLLRQGLTRIEPSARGVSMARLRREMRSRDLEHYAREGLIILSLCHGDPPIRGEARVYITAVKAHLREPEGYTFSATEVDVSAVEQFMNGPNVPHTAWLLGDDGGVRSVADAVPVNRSPFA